LRYESTIIMLRILASEHDAENLNLAIRDRRSKCAWT